MYIKISEKLDNMKPMKPIEIDKIYIKNSLFSRTRYRFVTHPDVGEGNIKVSSTDGIVNSKIFNIGTIDYNTGEIHLKNFQVDTYIGSAIKFYVVTRDPDITVKNNTILTIEEDEILVEVEQLRE